MNPPPKIPNQPTLSCLRKPHIAATIPIWGKKNTGGGGKTALILRTPMRALKFGANSTDPKAAFTGTAGPSAAGLD